MKFKMTATLAILGLSLISCGKAGLSGDVDFEMEPQSPLVINADFTIGSGDDAETIEAPWFESRYSFTNNSNQNLVVVTLKYTITGYKNGVANETESILDAGEGCEDTYERPYLAVVNPGETFSGVPTDGSGLDNCWPTSSTDFFAEPHLSPPNYERWYLYGLGDTDNNVYSVKVEALGWFQKVDTGEITERLTATSFFSTR